MPKNERYKILRIGIMLLCSSILASACSWNNNFQSTPDHYLAFLEGYFAMPGSYPNLMDEKLIEHINQSERTVKCAFSRFDFPAIADAMIQAQNRGVQVEYVSDIDYSGDYSSVQLLSAGIPCTFGDGKTRGTYTSDMSHNFCIIDEMYTWIAGSPVTWWDFNTTHTFGLDIYSEKIAEDFDQEFNQLVHGVFGEAWAPYDSAPLKAGNTYYTYQTHDFEVTLYFGPQEFPMSELIKEVYRAEQSVHFLASSFSDAALYDALHYKRTFSYIPTGQTDPVYPFTVMGIVNADGLDATLGARFRDEFLGSVQIYDDPASRIGGNVLIIDEALDRETICIYSNGFTEVYHDAQFDNWVDFGDSTLIIIRRLHPNGTNHTKYFSDFFKFIVFDGIWGSPTTNPIP